MPRRDIASVLGPQSVALVGASARGPGGRALVENLLSADVRGYAVNPTIDEVLGRPAYKSIADLPEVPDLVMLAVGPARIEAAFEDACSCGVRAFVVPGLGPDAGRDGVPTAQRLITRARSRGVAMLGPNCIGFARPGRASACVATLPPTFLLGTVGVVAQSGAVAELLLASGPRIGFSKLVTTGAEGTRDVADVLAHLAGDAETRAIGVFLESVRRPTAFTQALDLCARAGKPVVCLKVGRSSAARRTALAHTGAVVGSAEVLSAVLRQYGVIEVNDMHDLIETLEVLGATRWPRGTRMAAVSDSGGESSLLADNAETAGIMLQPFTASMKRSLRSAVPIPDWVPIENPLDITFRHEGPQSDYGAGIYSTMIAATRQLAQSKSYDVVLAQMDLSQYRGRYETELATQAIGGLATAAEHSDVFTAILSFHAADPPTAVAALAREHDIPILRGGRHAMTAIAAVAGWRPPDPQSPSSPTVETERSPLRAGQLSELESSDILERYGVRFAPRRHAALPVDAAEAAKALGLPVVVKVHGPAHKAAVNGVVVGIESAEAAAAATKRLDSEVIVARQLPPGPEILCGMTRDPDYGPVIAVGVGGRAVEALGLAAVGLGTQDHAQAVALVESAPGLSTLTTPAAREDLAQAVTALSKLALDHPEILECEINPLIAYEHGAIGVDALVVVAGAVDNPDTDWSDVPRGRKRHTES